MLLNTYLRKERKWSGSVVSYFLRPHGLQPTTLLHQWDYSGKSTGVGCHCLLQGIFPIQGSNPGLPHCGLYCLSHQGSPKISPAQMLPPVLHESESVSHSVMTDSLQPYGLYPPGPYVHGILQARIMEWVAIPFSRGSSQPRDWTQVSSSAGRFFTIYATWEARCNPITPCGFCFAVFA